MRIGLFGGSFNPFHTGHAMVVSYLAQFADLDEVWIMPSRQNPLKSEFLEQDPGQLHRLTMVAAGIPDLPNIKITEVELSMPSPNYTVDTLKKLTLEYPDYEFHIVIGGDNWSNFTRWKDAAEIIKKHHVIVYPRPGSDPDVQLQLLALGSGMLQYADRIRVLHEAPQVMMSSSFVRNIIAKGADAAGFVNSQVNDYIKINKLYQKSKQNYGKS